MVRMSSSPEKPVSVSILTEAIRYTLNQTFSSVWVEGEVSSLSRPSSGHIYFTLKDESAQINAILWRRTASALPFEIKEGQKLICGGHVDLYAQRGNYQLIVHKANPVGVGARELAFQQLKEKLQGEGLFDPSRKKTLPRYPKKVAVVTSPTGAAIRDFHQVLIRRWPAIHVIVVPVRVQGEGAADEIAAAVRSLDCAADSMDAIVVTRGGGSVEDLWSFNEESVVRAIADSRLPVISGVGHEIDITLCDLVADVRALTPSEAAERLVPDRTVFLKQMDNVQKRMTAALSAKIETARLVLDRYANHRMLVRPLEMLAERSQRTDLLEQSLHRVMQRRVERLNREMQSMTEKMELVSPLGILKRGYSLTMDGDNELVASVKDVAPGDDVRVRVSDGTISANVTAVE